MYSFCLGGSHAEILQKPGRPLPSLPVPTLPTYLPIPYLWETKKEILGPPCTTLGTGLRGGMKVAARIGEGLRREIEKEADAQGLGWATASTTLLSLKSLCGGGVPSSHPPSLGLAVFFLSVRTARTAALRPLRAVKSSLIWMLTPSAIAEFFVSHCATHEGRP